MSHHEIAFAKKQRNTIVQADQHLCFPLPNSIISLNITFQATAALHCNPKYRFSHKEAQMSRVMRKPAFCIC